MGAFRWQEESADFGGMSAIDLAEDGVRFRAIGDRGFLVSGQLLRQDGRITGVRIDHAAPLAGIDPAGDDRNFTDAEGLAWAEGAPFYVSFESVHRIARYENANAAPRRLPPPLIVRRGHANRGIEALAIDAAGRLFALPENAAERDGPHPLLLFDDAGWRIYATLPRLGRYKPVGADVGPEGQLYVLERWFRGPLGFQTRIRRFEITATGLAGGETVLETPARRHQNLEGLAVWRDAAGATRLTMVSDDNFAFFLKTEIVEYRLTD